jgi:hypothetical protein
MPPTLDQLLTLGTIAAPLIGGVAGAGQSADARRRAFEQEVYNRIQSARNAQMDYLTGRQGQAQRSAESFLANAPLGAEQFLVQRNAARANLIPAMAGRATPAGYGGVFNPFVGLSPESWGQTATAQAIAERRKALAALDPNFQFGSMAAYGLSGPGVVSAEEQVASAARSAAALRNEEERQMIALLTEQRRAADAANQAPAPAEAQSSKGGFWRTLGKIGLAAAPIVASAINPGLGLAMRSAIGGLTGMGQAALEGRGVKGAILGGALGAGTSALTRPSMPTTPASMGTRIQQAVLTPQALATIGGAALPTGGRAVVQAIAPFLPNTPLRSAPAPAGRYSTSLPMDQVAAAPSAQIPGVPAGLPGAGQTFEQLYGPAPVSAPAQPKAPTGPAPTKARRTAPAPTTRSTGTRPNVPDLAQFFPNTGLAIGTAPSANQASVQPQGRVQIGPRRYSEAQVRAVMNSPYLAQILAYQPELQAQIIAQQRKDALAAAQQRQTVAGVRRALEGR